MNIICISQSLKYSVAICSMIGSLCNSFWNIRRGSERCKHPGLRISVTIVTVWLAPLGGSTRFLRAGCDNQNANDCIFIASAHSGDPGQLCSHTLDIRLATRCHARPGYRNTSPRRQTPSTTRCGCSLAQRGYAAVERLRDRVLHVPLGLAVRHE